MRNLKKVIALVAVFAMIITSLSMVAFAASFDDVADTDTYSSAIETLNQLGILTGDDENNDGVMSFRPNDTITRAEITAILARMKGQTGAVAQTNTIFTDVPATHWASGYVASATNQGIINGYGDGTFGPDDNVQYQDVVKMVMENLGYKNYALDNGGYPTGYELAASRYGVLNNVVGGADGTESTRGQVAQIVANAIEAPLMDRLAYGGNGQYVIYDGSWQPLKTCLSEYLGVIKVKGKITSNEVTAVDGSNTPNTSTRGEKVTVYIEDLFKADNTYYDVDTNAEMYVGATDAADYFGYDVTIYVRKENSDFGTIISVTPTDGQTTASFTIDQYSYYDKDNNNIWYMRNENDRSASRLPIQNDAKVVYNGICGYDINEVFAPQGDAENDKYLVSANSSYSGEVTMVDNDEYSGYDYIFVDLAASGVVQELSSRGQLSFKSNTNAVGSRNKHNNVNRIDFSDASNDSYIKITKNGQPFDYTQLKEWDVLSIVANTPDNANGPNNGINYYDIEVLDGADTAIAGTVSRKVASDTSSGDYAYTIGDKTYDIADNAYNSSQIRPGSSGTFYVDKYGKIVAYNRDLNAQGGTSDNYAYILNAKMGSASFGADVPILQFIYKDGTIAEAQFASSVGIYNPTPDFRGADGATDYVNYQYKNNEDTVENALADLVGRVVTLNASNGAIRTITMPLTSETILGTDFQEDQTLYQATSANSYRYDQDDAAIYIGTNESMDVTADTLVFFIGRPGDGFKFGESAENQAVENCTVSNGAALTTMTGGQAVAYTNGNSEGYADVLVLFNSDIATSPDTGVAFVTSIGTGANNTLDVQYYQNGELKTATTSEDYSDPDMTASTQPGSLFKFGMINGLITSATPYLTFQEGTEIRSDVTGDELSGVPQIEHLYAPADGTVTSASDQEKVTFGAIVGINGSRVTVAPMRKISSDPEMYDELPEFDNTTRVQLGNLTANYYVYDAARSSRSRCGLGGLGDIYLDKSLAGDERGNSILGDDEYIYCNGHDKGRGPVAGMLDYVYVRDYQRTGDVVIYMQRQYGYDILTR